MVAQREPGPIGVNQVVLRRDFQVRDRLDEGKVKEYAAILDRLPPVEIARIDNTLFLVSGFHRFAAAVMLRSATVNAIVTDADENTAYEMAVKSNAAHGLPLTTEEKRKAAEGMLLRFTERSNRWIAEDIGISDPTVGVVRRDLEASAKISHLPVRYRRDGDRDICRCGICQPPIPQLPLNDAEPELITDDLEPAEPAELWDESDDEYASGEPDGDDGDWDDEAEEPEEFAAFAEAITVQATADKPIEASLVEEPIALVLSPAEQHMRAEDGIGEILSHAHKAMVLVPKWGGFDALAHRWSTRHQQEMLQILQNITNRLAEWQTILERELAPHD